MFTDIRKEKGFTLMETIISLGLGLISALMVFSVFTNGLKHVRVIRNNQALNSSAVLFLDRAIYLIKQGENFSPQDKKLNFTLDGNSETIDETTFGANGVEVDSLKFNLMERSIRINFTINKGSESLSATTTIAKRAF